MNTQEIIDDMRSNGMGYSDFRDWPRKDIKIMVKNSFPCSDYVASRVASELN